MKDSTSTTSPTNSNSAKEKSNVSGSTATPTTTTGAASVSSTNPNFRDTRAELVQLLKKKEEIEKSLSDIEEQIYAFETSYLKQTQDTGNCIRGWSNCLTSGTANQSSIDKSSKFRESDRLFSYSSATSYTLLGRDRLKREREKERRKTIRRNRELMQELSTSKKNQSETNTQATQILNEDPDEEIEDEDESTTSSEKPSSRNNTNASTTSKKRTKIKRLRNKRALSDSSQQSESRD